MRVVKKYSSAFSANLDKGILESEGIKSYILNENIAYSTAAVNTDFLAIELVVDDADYDSAMNILNSPIEEKPS